jgi:hypothetical protein
MLDAVQIACAVTWSVLGYWTFAYIVAGCVMALVVGQKVKGSLRLAFLSLSLALFFSISIALGRLPTPVPTLIVIGAWAWDVIRVAFAPCIPTSEGCAPPERGEAIFVIPLLAQWLVWYLVVRVGVWFARRVRQRRHSRRDVE